MNSDEEKLWKRIDELENSLSDTYYEYRNEIDELKSELKELRKLSAGMSYSSQTQSVSLSIQEQQSDSFYKSPDVTSKKPAEISKSNESVNEISPTRTTLNKIDTAPANKQSTPETQTDVWSAQPSKPAVRQSERVKFNEQPKEPGLIEVILSNFFQSIFSYLLSTLTIFSAPFHELYHRLIKLYYHYQKQGKAPVFLMTVAGLITLTVGFGYLLQYSFNTLFSDTLKALTGFVIGCGIIGAGILLSKKKTDFKDYGASVVALGVIFNYLTAYFVGPYYGLVGETSGLLLLLGVTLTSFTLAIVFETRVVSAITLVGVY